MAIDAVIFDMDGVLLDSEPLHLEAINDVLGPEGFHLSEEENRPFVGVSSLNTWNALVRRFSLPGTVDDYLGACDAAVMRRLLQPLEPSAGVLDLLAELERLGFKLGLASSSRRAWVDLTLRSLGVDRYFPVIVSGDAVTRGKPDPEIYLRAAGLLNVAPDRCLVVEDSLPGVTSAKGAGMKVLAVATRFTAHTPLDGADYRLVSLADFDPAILG